MSVAGMDEPLRRAIALAGGQARLAKVLDIARPSLNAWTCVPQHRVFQVAAATGIDPRVLRPDLTTWIEGEVVRRGLAQSHGGLPLTAYGDAVGVRWDGPTIEEGLVDLWAALGAVAFVARRRGLKPQQLHSGTTSDQEAARAYAMALAKVVGRARSTHIANVFQCSRQNVDNAAERYLRARDGDDPEDYIRGQFPADAPRVWEPGTNRLRRAKQAVEGMWEAEQAFSRFLHGEDLALPDPERKRA